MTVQVKICGIRTRESALAAIEAGADYLGFNFVPDSRRFILPEIAAEIASEIRGRIRVVGVFQNADLAFVKKIARLLALDFAQLHGKEGPDYVTKLSIPIIKTIHSPTQIPFYRADYFLLDRVLQGKGPMVDVRQAAATADTRPIFLAGGLTPRNVSGVVRKVRPFAVDVARGIESRGVPDARKIKTFVTNAKKTFL